MMAPAQLPDYQLLDRATELDRVLVSQDDDLLAEANRRQDIGAPFAGVIYSHQLGITVGQFVRDLELIAKAGESEDFQNRVEFLPL